MRLRPILVIGFLVLAVHSGHASQKRHNKDEYVSSRSGTHSTPNLNIAPLVLPDKRIVVSAIDTVYRLRPDRTVQWKYVTREGLSGQPAFNSELNEIAVVGYGLVFTRIDANSGQVKSVAGVNGRATFTQVAPY